MLANSEFVALLKQANTDSSKMAEVIGVSEAQLRFITNTASGMGLIKCGSVVIPFDNQISKDTELYKLYNTNIHEKIAEQKKRDTQSKISVDWGRNWLTMWYREGTCLLYTSYPDGKITMQDSNLEIQAVMISSTSYELFFNAANDTDGTMTVTSDGTAIQTGDTIPGGADVCLLYTSRCV